MTSARLQRVSARRQAAESRRLRKLVKRDQACVGDLSPVQSRLLTLRAGLGGTRPESQAGTARALHVSASREASLEHGALVALHGAAQEGCASSSPGVPMVIPAGHQLVADVSFLPQSSAATAASAAHAGSPGSTRPASSSGPARHHGSASSSAASTARVRVERAAVNGSQATDWLVVLLVLAAGAVGLVLIPARRRHVSAWQAAGPGPGMGAPVVLSTAAVADPPAERAEPTVSPAPQPTPAESPAPPSLPPVAKASARSESSASTPPPLRRPVPRAALVVTLIGGAARVLAVLISRRGRGPQH